ncbi:MAG: hypothetical protein JXB49_33030 [Bacteroidales bacterium]|nr:hypothetical protein [Bacteroidales bacterium]
MKLLKKISCFVIVTISIVAFAMMQPVSSGSEWKTLSQAEMNTIAGGMCDQHCSDAWCTGWTCDPYWGRAVGGGGTGRACQSSSIATYCDDASDVWCLDWYWSCNAGCTVCSGYKSYTVGDSCFSSGSGSW